MASTSEEATKSETPTTDGSEVEQSPSSSRPPGDLNTADELMESGSKAYDDRNFAEATNCFRRALAIRVKHYGELAPQCSDAYIRYGLALLGDVPILKGDDSMAFVPKEVDYHHRSDKDGSISVAMQDGSQIHIDRGVKWGAGSENLESAWNQLDMARTIIEKQQRIAQERIRILGALEEDAFQGGDLKSHLEVGAKILSSTDPAGPESTQTMKPSSDPQIEKGEGSAS